MTNRIEDKANGAAVATEPTEPAERLAFLRGQQTKDQRTTDAIRQNMLVRAGRIAELERLVVNAERAAGDTQP